MTGILAIEVYYGVSKTWGRGRRRGKPWAGSSSFFFFKECCFRVRVRVDTNTGTAQHHRHKNDRSTPAHVIARVRCIYCNVPIQIKLKLIFKVVLMTYLLAQLKVYFSLLYAEWRKWMPESVLVRWLKCQKTLLNLICAQVSYFRANECLYLRIYAIFCMNWCNTPW